MGFYIDDSLGAVKFVVIMMTKLGSFVSNGDTAVLH